MQGGRTLDLRAAHACVTPVIAPENQHELKIEHSSSLNEFPVMLEIRHYLDGRGTNPFLDWFRDLRDPIGKVAIVRRLNRMEQGNFGDFKVLRESVCELRVDTGPGYRIYFARSGKTVILLLCAGKKRSQENDIERATKYWRDWTSRNNCGRLK